MVFPAGISFPKLNGIVSTHRILAFFAAYVCPANEDCPMGLRQASFDGIARRSRGGAVELAIGFAPKIFKLAQNRCKRHWNSPVLMWQCFDTGFPAGHFGSF
ncbi:MULTISPECIES: hypothetical protein [Rhodomicrobium]|uniref:hypothetical protein n=1 Tax=Rhodomicrobium TaxID=1068 RepID=UPI000F74ABD0|nr:MULTISPECIES: hypothetical protein [Rhodomicrobium]